MLLTNPQYSKADYLIFASAIRAARAEWAALKHPEADGAAEGFNAVIWQLCKLFKDDNPRFEELKFIAACSSTV
jgi:hypothetical protein